MDTACGPIQARGAEAKLSVPEEIEGRIQSIVFRAADGTFSIARILRDGSPEPLTAAGYLAVSFTLGNVVEPRLMGRSLGLSTLVVLAASVPTSK